MFLCVVFFFFFNDTATTEIYTLSLHDALPIRTRARRRRGWRATRTGRPAGWAPAAPRPDRESTRLNSSHVEISYAVFCLKKKKKRTNTILITKKKKTKKTNKN